MGFLHGPASRGRLTLCLVAIIVLAFTAVQADLQPPVEVNAELEPPAEVHANVPPPVEVSAELEPPAEVHADVPPPVEVDADLDAIGEGAPGKQHVVPVIILSICAL
jgi:hypothetical protein